MKIKDSLVDVQKKFTEKKLLMLDQEYINSKHKINFYCNKHDYLGKVAWSDFKRGKGGCKQCNQDNHANKFSIEKIRQEVELKGFKLLSEHYKNSKTNMSFECSVHGTFETTYDRFKRTKHGCPECAKDYVTQSQTASIQDIKLEYEKYGFTLLESEYQNWNTPMKCICHKHLDKIVYISRSNVKKSGCRHCKSDALKGENSHLWKGGITPENRAQRETIDYKDWRKQVFVRDNYTCQCCGNRGLKINAHHIENFSDNADLRTDIYNGITLCEECHAFKHKGSYHHTYGNYNNNIFQLQEYFDDIRSQLDLPLVNIETIINRNS